MSIVFGSAEAAAILEADKELQRLGDVDGAWMAATQRGIADCNDEIESLQERIDALEVEREELEASTCPLTGEQYSEIVERMKEQS